MLLALPSFYANTMQIKMLSHLSTLTVFFVFPNQPLIPLHVRADATKLRLPDYLQSGRQGWKCGLSRFL